MFPFTLYFHKDFTWKENKNQKWMNICMSLRVKAALAKTIWIGHQSLKIDNLEMSKTSGQPTWQLNYTIVLILTYNTLVILWDPLNSGSHPAHCFPGPYPCIKKTLVLSQARRTPPPPSCWAYSSPCGKQFRQPAISQKYPYGFRLQWAYSSKHLLKK